MALGRLALALIFGPSMAAIMVSAVQRGMLRRTEEKIDYLGIDEKSSETGHTYCTILTDIGRFRVLDLVRERKLEAAEGLLQTLTPAQRTSVKAVAVDMWPAYMSAARNCLPQADIVHDKFHVSKYLGEAMEAVRKQASKSTASCLKPGTRPWLAASGSGCVSTPMAEALRRLRSER